MLFVIQLLQILGLAATAAAPGSKEAALAARIINAVAATGERIASGAVNADKFEVPDYLETVAGVIREGGGPVT